MGLIGHSLRILDHLGNDVVVITPDGVLLKNSVIDFGIDATNIEIKLNIDSSMSTGDILVGKKPDVLTTVDPNVTTTRKYLSQIGDGVLPLTTTWEAIIGGGTGDVVGPASAVNNNLVAFDGTTGKLIKDSGVSSSGSGLTQDQVLNRLAFRA